MTKFAADPKVAREFAKLGRADSKAFKASVAAIKTHAVEGVLPPEYALEWRTGVVLDALELTDNAKNRGVARGDKHKALWNMASARLKRRVAAAGIENGTAQGRTRGTPSKRATGAPAASGTPAQHAPTAPTVQGRPLKAGKKARAEAAQVTFAGMKVPVCETVGELDTVLKGLAAFARSVVTASEVADDVTRAAVMAMTAAVEQLNRTRVESEGDDE